MIQRQSKLQFGTGRSGGLQAAVLRAKGSKEEYFGLETEATSAQLTTVHCSLFTPKFQEAVKNAKHIRKPWAGGQNPFRVRDEI